MNSNEARALEQKVYGFLKKNKLETSSFLVAFSGGSDSLGLLVCLSKLVRVEALYVDHGIRPLAELEKEIRLNQENCGKLGLAFHLQSLGRGAVQSLSKSRGNGLEEACRVLRYEKLEQAREALNLDYIATAHTSDDVCETMLMRILRGSPLQNIRGPRPMNGVLVRPMLGLSKKEIQDYLVEQGFSWSEDSTNLEPFCLRNRVRLNLIPEIQKIFPSYRSSLCSLDNSISLLKDYSSDNYDLETLQGLDDNTLLMAIYRLWDKTVDSNKELSLAFAQSLISMIKKGRGRLNFGLYQFAINKGKLVLNKVQNNCYSYMVDSDEGSIDIGEGKLFVWGPHISGDKKTLYLDSSALKGNIRLENAKENMVIRLEGGTKTVFSLLGDQKVPLALKAQVPVLMEDENVVAVFARAFGGSDRLCVDFKLSLAPSQITLYSIVYT